MSSIRSVRHDILSLSLSLSLSHIYIAFYSICRHVLFKGNVLFDLKTLGVIQSSTSTSAAL